MQCLLDRKPALISLLVMAFVFITVVGGNYLRPNKVTTFCCRSVSRRRVPFTITHYKTQDALYPCVAAVIFYTKEKGPICVNPNALWVKRKMRYINSNGIRAKRIK